MQVRLLLHRDCIEVLCAREHSMAVQDKLVPFYPYHFNRTRTAFMVSLYHAPELLKTFRGWDESTIDEMPEAARSIYLKEMHRRRVTADLLANGPVESPVVNSKLTLTRHQQLARELAKVNDRYGFFYDTRTGKTLLSLTIIHDDIMQHPNHKWLIICPLVLIENAWLQDSNDYLQDMPLHNCYASTPAKRQALIAEKGHNVYITNTESFVNYMPYFERLGFVGCFVDESSSMKSHSANISKALVQFSREVKRFYLLSGVPAPNGEHEYYMQLASIDYYGIQSSFNQFKHRYFVNISYDPRYEKLIMRPDRQQEFNEVLSRYSIYVDKEDAITTPGRDFIPYEFDMPDDLKKHYRELKKQLVIEISDEKKITVKSAAAKYNKLNQVSSGFVIDTKAKKQNELFGTNLQEVYLLSDYRFKLLEELLAKIGDEQVIIWAYFREEFKIIKQMLGDNCRCIYGGTNIEEKNEAIQLFKAGKIQYLVANPASADKGLTLTNCHIAIYFSLSYSYELFRQSKDRIYADIRKQPHRCIYYIFLAKQTLEPIIYYDVLLGKQMISDAVLNFLKSPAINGS
jgi:hypothetical protein